MPPKGPEYELQQQIVGQAKGTTSLANMFGWEHVHFRAALTKQGWRTPGSGTLAKGWPDLSLFRDRGNRRQIIFAELKSNVNSLTPDERRVLDFLRLFEGDYARGSFNDVTGVFSLPPGEWQYLSIGVYLWRPRDFDVIQATLR